MSTEYWWNYTDKAKPKYSEENLKWCNFVHEEAHMVWSGNQASVVKKKGKGKGKGLPQQAEVAHGVPGRLRPWIFLTFGTTRVVDHQPYTKAAFTPGEIPGTHF